MKKRKGERKEKRWEKKKKNYLIKTLFYESVFESFIFFYFGGLDDII